MIEALEKAHAVVQPWGLVLPEGDRNESFPRVLSIKSSPRVSWSQTSLKNCSNYTQQGKGQGEGEVLRKKAKKVEFLIQLHFRWYSARSWMTLWNRPKGLYLLHVMLPIQFNSLSKTEKQQGTNPTRDENPKSAIEDWGWQERTALNQVQVWTQQLLQLLLFTSKLSWHCGEGGHAAK